MDHVPLRSRLQRSVSERPAPLRRSTSLFGVLGRAPWVTNDDEQPFSSSGDDEPPPAPPSPSVSMEEAKRARKQKIQRLFKQGVGKVMRERAEEMDRMAKKGALYVMDAFAGRLKHGMAEMSTKSPYIFATFRVQTSSAWMATIIASSVAHSLMVFLEPRPGKGSEDGWLSARALFVLETFLVFVYAMDVALKVSYMGFRNYVKKPWQKLMIAIVVTLAVDASGIVGFRFARALRPAILSVRTRSIRRFYEVVSSMLPGFLRICLPVLFFLLLSASYAALSFGRAKDAFADPTAAGYAIWILMVCADNYENLVNEPSPHPAYIPFVVMVIVVGSMFLLSLLLGVTYDVFIEHTTEQVKSERLKELRGLNMAFATMDPEGTGKLSMVVWDRFLLHLMPRTTRQERALYFEIASGFADTLDVLGFMDLRQVLSYSFVNVNAIERAGKRQKLEKMPAWVVSLLQRMEDTLHSRRWRHILGVVVLVDCMCLPNSIPHQGPSLLTMRLTAACGLVLLVDQAFQMAEWIKTGWSGPGPLRLPGKSVHTKVAGAAVLMHALVVAVMHCRPLLTLVCSSLSRATDSLDDAENDGVWCGTEMRDGMGGNVGLCPLAGGVQNRYFNDPGVCIEVDGCLDSFLMLAYTLRLARCWRLVTLNDTLHDHVDTFFSVVPVFAQTLSFALIVAYFFAMIAMQAFAHKAAAFRDAGMSLRTTLQLFVGVDFSSVVESTVQEFGPTAFLFFVAYHVVGVLIVFNLLTAIMIQLYGQALNEKSRQGVEEQRKADQELQDHLYEHNQKQRVLRLWGRRVTQGAASLNITRGTKVSSGRDARRMLGAGSKSQMPTMEELKQCQKHAKVDLVKALRERTRGDNSLRTFERSFYQKLKSTASGNSLNYQTFTDGEIIYHRGEQQAMCYFVHKGVVRLESSDGMVDTKEKGEMFGEEALMANLAASATATAEGPVECVGLDRKTFTETHGTLENMGLIFLRLQRSGSLSTVESLPSDGSRRSAFSSASGRSSRSSFGAMGTSSQFDVSASDFQIPERWRNRRTALLSAAAARRGCSSTTTGLNGSAGGGDGGDACAGTTSGSGSGNVAGGAAGASNTDRRTGNSCSSSERGVHQTGAAGGSARWELGLHWREDATGPKPDGDRHLARRPLSEDARLMTPRAPTSIVTTAGIEGAGVREVQRWRDGNENKTGVSSVTAPAAEAKAGMAGRTGKGAKSAISGAAPARVASGCLNGLTAAAPAGKSAARVGLNGGKRGAWGDRSHGVLKDVCDTVGVSASHVRRTEGGTVGHASIYPRVPEPLGQEVTGQAPAQARWAFGRGDRIMSGSFMDPVGALSGAVPTRGLPGVGGSEGDEVEDSSPEVSPSMAPSSRKQQMLQVRSSSKSRKNVAGEELDGESDMSSTWSMNSPPPSPVAARHSPPVAATGE